LPLNGTGFGFTVTLRLPATPGVEIDDVVVVVVLGDVGVLELLHDVLTHAAANRHANGDRVTVLRNMMVSSIELGFGLRALGFGLLSGR
jgi:hypothetical protein